MTTGSPVLIIRKFEFADKEQVINLWRECNLLFPGNDPENDIRLKTDFQPDLFLVGVTGDIISATLMAGYDGHRGWLNYLGVLPRFQGTGQGEAIVCHAVNLLRSLGCPKVNLQVRNSNTGVTGFYKKIGFIEHEVSCMQLKIS